MNGPPTFHVTWEEFGALVPHDSGSGTYARILRTNVEVWAVVSCTAQGPSILEALAKHPGLPLLHPHHEGAMPVDRVSYEQLDELGAVAS